MDSQNPTYRPHENEPYMSQRQTEYFRRHLLQWRDLVLRQTLNCRSELNRERDESGDIIDRSVELMSQRLALLNNQRAQLLVERINAALARIEAGRYGYCLHTGEEIGLQRLLAWPIATLSIEAQEALERRHRLPA